MNRGFSRLRVDPDAERHQGLEQGAQQRTGPAYGRGRYEQGGYVYTEKSGGECRVGEVVFRCCAESAEGPAPGQPAWHGIEQSQSATARRGTWSWSSWPACWSPRVWPRRGWRCTNWWLLSRRLTRPANRAGCRGGVPGVLARGRVQVVVELCPASERRQLTDGEES